MDAIPAIITFVLFTLFLKQLVNSVVMISLQESYIRCDEFD